MLPDPTISILVATRSVRLPIDCPSEKTNLEPSGFERQRQFPMARADRPSIAQVGEEFGVGRLGQLDRFEVVGMLDVDTYRSGRVRILR